MKISLAVSLLILAIGVGLGWQDRQRLVHAQHNHEKLVAEAAKLGIALDGSKGAAAVRVTKRGRGGADREAVAKQAAADFIAFAKEMEAMEGSGQPPDPAMQKRIFKFLERMMALDADQLKILIAAVRADPTLKEESRRGVIGFSIMSMANDHPRSALALFTESSDLFEEDGMGRHVISSSLAKWAKDDPVGALEWVRTNSAKHPDLVTDDAKRGLISGAAVQDPKLAFSLIGELAIEDDSGRTIRGIIDAARTPAERTATLAALRGHLATITDEGERNRVSNQAIGDLVRRATSDGFEAGSKWIEGAGFSPQEMETLAAGRIGSGIKSEDTGKWIEWMGETIPGEKSSAGITQMVESWTENDYQAAGKWLTTTQPGPTREAAVRSYASTVARYEPEVAAQWALTLPPGKDREETLKHIYGVWPKNDSAAQQAAEKFAKEHGIKK